jgi:hypothetical protein
LIADAIESDHAAADQCVSGPMMTRHSGRFLLAVAGSVGALALIGLHAGAALSFARLATYLTLSPSLYAVGAALVLLVVGKIGLLLWRLTRGQRAH